MSVCECACVHCTYGGSELVRALRKSFSAADSKLSAGDAVRVRLLLVPLRIFSRAHICACTPERYIYDYNNY